MKLEWWYMPVISALEVEAGRLPELTDPVSKSHTKTQIKHLTGIARNRSHFGLLLVLMPIANCFNFDF
jgi:hypothetical protein